MPTLEFPFKLLAAAWIVTSLFIVALGFSWGLFEKLARRIGAVPKASNDGGVEGLLARSRGIDLERRRVLGRIGRALPDAAVATSVSGLANGERDFVVRQERVRLRGLPSGLHGFKIGQITDLHVGAFISPEYLRRAIDAMKHEGTHLQVMTGDLIDDYTQLGETCDALATCAARTG